MSKKGTKETQIHTYETRDIVLGKVRGYPPWPGMIVDPETVPEKVSADKPPRKTNFYCVQFFPTGEYSWLVAKDISKLRTHEIESYINEPFKKSGELLSGYRIALDPSKWEAENKALAQKAIEEEPEIDQLESENDGESKKPKVKKRKRESDSAPPATKTKKTPKAKKDPSELAKKKSSSATTKPRKHGSKLKTMVESEDDGEHVEAEVEDDDAGRSKQASPPLAKKLKREKDEDGEDSKLASDPEAMKVRDWRHKLQRIFLSNKTLPKEEDIPSLDALFRTVEDYENITIEYLQFSKIGKVMRHIAVLAEEKVPKDEEYKFRDRAKALVDKWHQILNANKMNGSENGIPVSAKTNKSENDRVETHNEKEQCGEEQGGEEACREVASNPKLNGKTGGTPIDADDTSNSIMAGDLLVLPTVAMSEA